MIAPPPSSYISELPGSDATPKKTEQKGKMVYAFQANGEGELSVAEGRDVVLLEPDGNIPPSRRFIKLSRLTSHRWKWLGKGPCRI